jgi:hypothetical protein
MGSADRSQESSLERAADGTVVHGGEATISTIKLDDCIASDDISEGAVFEVVPCEDDHLYLFYSAYPLFEVDGITSEAEAKKQAEPICRQKLEVTKPDGVPKDAEIRTIVQYRENGAQRGSLLCFVAHRQV